MDTNKRSDDVRRENAPADSTPRYTEGEEKIEERLIDEREDSQADIVKAAREAFEKDQENPEHPSRIERRHGADDPSHSRGSSA